MKKFLSLLFLLITFTLLPQSAFANDEIFVESDFAELDFSILSFPDDENLSEDQKEILKNLFKNAIENYETSVDISSARVVYEDSSQIHMSVISLFANIVNDTPEYFYVDLSKDFSLTIGNDNILQTIQITYTYDIETIKERTVSYKQEAQTIIDEMNKKNITSDFDIALYLHDYLALNCEYDTISANSNTFKGHCIDSALLEKTAVCQGYSSAYKYLLKQYGIECVNVYSNVGAHEWSMVKIDGNWYHVDITFDDPVYDRLGYVSHELFLLTDEELANYDINHTMNSHSSWYTTEGEHTATDTTYSSATWRNTTTAIAFTDNYRFYTTYIPYDSENKNSAKTYIVQCDENMNIINNNYYEIDTVWFAKNSAEGVGLFWPGFYSGLSEYNNSLYYNTGNKLMQIDTTSDIPQAEAIFNYESQISDYPSGVYLFGSYINGNKLYYAEINYVTIENEEKPLGTKNNEKMYYELPEKEIGATLDDSALAIDTESNTITGTVVANINSDTKEDLFIYFAVYENNVLKYIKSKTKNDTEFDVSLSYNEQSKYSYKLFVWNEVLSPYLTIISGTIE